MSLSKNKTSLAGEFATLSQLALRGFDANLTLGHTKGVDILLSDPGTDTMRRIEVKTAFDRSPYESKDFGYVVCAWQLGKKNESITDPNLFYSFVNIEEDTKSFEFYIVPSQVVAEFLTKSHQYWLDGDESRKDSTMRQFMLGSSEHKYPKIKLPLADKFEDNWSILR